MAVGMGHPPGPFVLFVTVGASLSPSVVLFPGGPSITPPLQLVLPEWEQAFAVSRSWPCCNSLKAEGPFFIWSRHSSVEVKYTSWGMEHWCMVMLPCVFGITETQSKWVYLLCSDCSSTFPGFFTFKLPWCVVRLWSCLGVGPGIFLGEDWVTGNKITT